MFLIRKLISNKVIIRLRDIVGGVRVLSEVVSHSYQDRCKPCVFHTGYYKIWPKLISS